MMKVLLHELMTHIPYKVVLLSRIDWDWRSRPLCGSLLPFLSRRPAPASSSVGCRWDYWTFLPSNFGLFHF